MQLTERHLAYWQALLRKTAVLLAIWFVVTYVVGYYAESLQFDFFGLALCFLGWRTRVTDCLCTHHLVLRPIDESN